MRKTLASLAAGLLTVAVAPAQMPPAAPPPRPVQVADECPRQVYLSVLIAQMPTQTLERIRHEQAGPKDGVIPVTDGVKLNESVRGLKAAGNGVDILSNPSLMLTDRQTGFFQVGQQVPVQTLVGTDNSSKQFLYASTGITLRVTPDIAADAKSITLKTEFEVATPNPKPVDLGNGTKGTSVDTQSAEMTIRVDSGKTVVVPTRMLMNRPVTFKTRVGDWTAGNSAQLTLTRPEKVQTVLILKAETDLAKLREMTRPQPVAPPMPVAPQVAYACPLPTPPVAPQVAYTCPLTTAQVAPQVTYAFPTPPVAPAGIAGMPQPIVAPPHPVAYRTAPLMPTPPVAPQAVDDVRVECRILELPPQVRESANCAESAQNKVICDPSEVKRLLDAAGRDKAAGETPCVILRTDSGRSARVEVGESRAFVVGADLAVADKPTLRPKAHTAFVGYQLEVVPIIYGNGQLYLEENYLCRQVSGGTTPTTVEVRSRTAKPTDAPATLAVQPHVTFTEGKANWSAMTRSGQPVVFVGPKVLRADPATPNGPQVVRQQYLVFTPTCEKVQTTACPDAKCPTAVQPVAPPQVAYSCPLPTPPVAPAGIAGMPQPIFVPPPVAYRTAPLMPTPPVMPVAALPCPTDNLVARVYSVADIVTPIPTAGPLEPCGFGTQCAANGTRLAKIVCDYCQPKSWASCGGRGMVTFEPVSNALLVANTPAAHAEVEKLLTSLRKLHDTNVVVEMKCVTVPAGLCKAACLFPEGKMTTCLTADATARWYQMLTSHPATVVLAAPKLTVFNGQTADICVADQATFDTKADVVLTGGQAVVMPKKETVELGAKLRVQATVSADKKFVRLACNGTLTEAAGPCELVPLTTLVTPKYEGGSEGVPVPFTTFLQNPKVQTLSFDRTVSVPDGNTVAVFVGTRTDNEKVVQAVPLLSQIPYVNRLFTNHAYKPVEKEVVVLLTPKVLTCPTEPPTVECVRATCTAPTSPAAALVNQYRAAVAAGKSDEAMKLAVQALALDPGCFAR